MLTLLSNCWWLVIAVLACAARASIPLPPSLIDLFIALVVFLCGSLFGGGIMSDLADLEKRQTNKEDDEDDDSLRPLWD